MPGIKFRALTRGMVLVFLASRSSRYIRALFIPSPDRICATHPPPKTSVIFQPLRIYRAIPVRFYAPSTRTAAACSRAYPMQLQQLVTKPRQSSSPCILHASLHVLVVYITWSRIGMAQHAFLITLSLLSHVPVFFSAHDDLSIKPVYCATLAHLFLTPSPLFLSSSFSVIVSYRERETPVSIRAITHAQVAGQSSPSMISGARSALARAIARFTIFIAGLAARPINRLCTLFYTTTYVQRMYVADVDFNTIAFSS